MNKFIKIANTILMFLVVMLLASFVWYKLEIYQVPETRNIVTYTEFLLYLFGYGELNISGMYTKPFFTTVAILSLSLLSSAFTINLFDWKKRITIHDKMLVFNTNKNNYTASIAIESKNKDIYNLRIKLITDIATETFSEEREIPFILSRTTELINFDIVPGSSIYKYLRSTFLDDAYKSVLVIMVSYTDISSGRDYTICRKYQYSHDLLGEKNNIIFINEDVPEKNDVNRKFLKYIATKNNQTSAKKLKSYIEDNIFSIDLKNAQPINANEIELKCNNAKSLKNQKITANIHFDNQKKYQNDDFTMLCISTPLGHDWTKYYDLNCSINFEIIVSKGLYVTLELKNIAGDPIISPVPKFEKNTHYSFKMHTFSREEWENVKEICFTVFYGDIKKKTLEGSFALSKLWLEAN